MRLTVIPASIAAKTSKAAKRKRREDLIESDTGHFFLDLINIQIQRDANLGHSFTTIYLSSEMKIRNHILSSDILDAIGWVLNAIDYKVIVSDGKFIRISWTGAQC
tara:strand:+ start:27 stop:344 length:318 start_codon:yes stop_codon:yes gene_type:complete